MKTESETFPLYPQSEPKARNFLSNRPKPPQSCYSPEQIKRAYGINRNFSAKGMKIALIEAYYHPDVQNDLDRFCDEFSLPGTTLEIFGDMSPAPDESWIVETASDVQWAHAIAPDAQIAIYCAASDEYGDLFKAVSDASADNADVISMSFGSEEFRTQTDYEEVFRFSDSVFVASSGDVGGKVFFPSSSPFVVSVGGTSLYLSPSGSRLGEEIAWRNSGGGPSLYNEIPEYQRIFEGIPELSGNKRATPDIAFYADSSPGFAVYYTDKAGNGMWTCVGGTSVAAPCIAGIIALSWHNDELKNKSYPEFLYTLAGKTEYNTNSDSFRDIIKGNNMVFEALVGYDLCTGLGTPKKIFVTD